MVEEARQRRLAARRVSGRLPDFPWDHLLEHGERARAHPDGIVDLSVGTHVDPTPEVVQEALCFGWIDSTVRRLDEQRGMQLLTPRKRGSTWSASNKQRVARLQEQGLIEAAGLAAIRRAKADGSWTVLDAVERLEVPADLAAALAGLPGAQQGYDAYPPSARKQALWWVVSAKRPATRANRIERIVEAAARGERGWPQ